MTSFTAFSSAIDGAQANYLRAILPGSRARFTIRFWNLEETELQRLIWSVTLGADGAHKIGKHRHLGMGSLKLKVSPESYLIDWAKRYGGNKSAWLRKNAWPEFSTPAVIVQSTRYVCCTNS